MHIDDCNSTLFRYTWPILLLTTLGLLLFSNPVLAGKGTQSLPFTMIIMNDPQIPWWRRDDYPSSCGSSLSDAERKLCAAEIENRDRVVSILDITSLGTWPSLSGTSSPTEGTSVQTPLAVIINGDLTNYFNLSHGTNGNELDLYEKYYVGNSDSGSGESLDSMFVLPGLGNHDYQNNVEDCYGGTLNSNHCAEQAVEYIDRMVTQQRVPNFPAYWVQSYDVDSLAYSWEMGPYHFVQLQNYPTYEETTLSIEDSIDWLADDLARATAAGKYIVINMHDLLSTSSSDLDPILNANNVVAIFKGHNIWRGSVDNDGDGEGDCTGLDQLGYLGDYQTNVWGVNIPYFQGGHSGECDGFTDDSDKLLLVEFGADYMTVATVDTKGGTPDWHNETDKDYYDTWDFSSFASQPPIEPYGFVAIGSPDEDLYSRQDNENDAGAVDVYYRTERGAYYGQRWTQDNMASSAVEGDDQHGYALAVGDFNGDGYPDLASGAPYEDTSGNNAGMVSIVYGTDTGLNGDIQVLTQASYGGTREADDRFGSALAAGDFDGDGKDDLAVGAPGEDVGGGCGNDAGAINVFYGTSSGLSETNGDNYIDQTEISSFNCEGDDRMGSSLAAGDFDADGYDDLAVGLPGEDLSSGGNNDDGAVLVIFGSSSRLNLSDTETLNQSVGNIGSIEADDEFGFALAAGDFDGDGYADLAVAAPTEDLNCNDNGNKNDTGYVGVYFGASNGLNNGNNGTRLSQENVSGWSCEANDQFGFAMAAGDFNRDGYDELAVGLPYEDIGSESNSGGFIVFNGASSGLSQTRTQNFTQGSFGYTDEADDRLGYALAAGDANLDGYDDLAVSAIGEDTSSGNDVGMVHVFWGSSSRLSYADADITTLTQNSSALVTDGQEGEDLLGFGGDHFGRALAITPRLNTPPTADAGSDQTVTEGDTVNLNGSFTDPDPADSHTFLWELDSASGADCNPSPVPAQTTQDISFTPKDDCVYTFEFTVTDDAGESDSDRVRITVNNDNPVISLSVDSSTITENGTVELTVDFTDAGIVDVHDIEINWDDVGNNEGTHADTLPVGTRTYVISHQYLDDDPTNTSSDSYTISVRIDDDDGGTDSDTTDITVNNDAPAITDVRVDAGSIDEDGTVTVTVDFSDDGTLDEHVIEINWDSLGNSENPVHTQTLTVGDRSYSFSHQYLDDHPSSTASDDYTISVKVTDDDLGTDTNTVDVTVNNVDPVLNSLSVNTPINENDTTTLSGTITDTGTLDTFILDVNWGDPLSPNNVEQFSFGTSSINSGGVSWNPTTRNFTIDHQYLDDNPTATASDTYTITAVVTDDDTGTDTDNVAVTVNNTDPEIQSLAVTTPIDENDTATLTGHIGDTGTLDTFILDVNWGDALSPNNVEQFSFGTSAINSGGVVWDPTTRNFSVEHQYLDDNPSGTSSDSYTISVTVTDDDTGTDSDSVNITVNNLDPVATIDSVIDQLTGLAITYVHDGTTTMPGDMDIVLVGTTIEVEGSYTDVGTLDTHSAVINWDDGTGDEVVSLFPDAPANPQNGVTGTATHAYATDVTPGIYATALTVTDDDTGLDTPTAEIEVVDATGALEDALEDIQDVIDAGGLDVEAELALYESLYKITGNPESEPDGDGDGNDENGALDHLERDILVATLVKIQQAIQYLEAAEAADASLDMTASKAQLTLTAKSIVQGAIDDAAAVATKKNQLKKIASAEALMANGDADLSAGDYIAALDDYRDAVRQVANMIKR